MAKFHGPVNLLLGEPAWAVSEYDHESLDYVIDVSGDDLKKFRAVADGYGFVEVPGSEPKAPAKRVAPAKADKGD